jgi:hypothetical protein
MSPCAQRLDIEDVHAAASSENRSADRLRGRRRIAGRRRIMRRVWLALGALASLTVSSIASAADCDADVVLVRGSSASQKLIEAVAKVAVLQGVKIVYSSAGSSCVGGVYEAVTPITTTSGRAATANTSFDAAAPTATCTLNPPRPADIGVADVYASSCAGIAGVGDTTLPPDVTDTLGPVQAFTLSVNDDPSFPVAISAEAAFNTFGIIARGGDASFAVAPWTVPADVFGRKEDSGTWQTWARNLGLISQKPVSVSPQSGAKDVLGALNTANRASALGIIALNDIVPTNGVAPKVRPLAFKAKGQDFAYYPSSTSTASDMINVRDGHYAVWANLHFFARKTGGNYAAKVQTVLGLLDGKEAVSAVTKIRAVPKCAMQVSRSSDGGDFSAYKPEQPCGCFFEQEASGTAPASCKACTAETAATACGASGQCVFGFCEAK